MVKGWRQPNFGLTISYAPCKDDNAYTNVEWSKLKKDKWNEKDYFKISRHVLDVIGNNKKSKTDIPEMEKIPDGLYINEKLAEKSGSETETESVVEEVQQIGVQNSRKQFRHIPVYMHGQSMMRRKETSLEDR
eukprot:UN21636